MNRLSLLIVVLATAATLQACKNSADDNDTAIVDSVTVVKNTDGKQNIIAEKIDADFMAAAARSNLAALQLGTLGRQQGIHKRIKTFGMVLVADQSKINYKIKNLASAKNIALSVMVDPGKKDTLTMLSKKPGEEFDKIYVAAVNKEYKKDIAIFDYASKNCADPDIKAFAAKTLPRLQAHLEAINAISDSMK